MTKRRACSAPNSPAGNGNENVSRTKNSADVQQIPHGGFLPQTDKKGKKRPVEAVSGKSCLERVLNLKDS